MNENRPGASGGFSRMGIPLAGGTDGSPDGSDADGANERPRIDALDFDGEVGDVADGLGPVSHDVYETTDGVGLSLLVENTGTRAFERVEVRVSVGDDTAEFVTASGAELGHLGPGDRWRFWVPLEGETEAAWDATPRYTVDLDAT